MQSIALALGKSHEVGLDKIIYLAVHYGLYMARLVPRAVILDSPIIEDVAADLCTPLDFLLVGLDLGLSSTSALELLVIELRA